METISLIKKTKKKQNVDGAFERMTTEKQNKQRKLMHKTSTNICFGSTCNVND